MSEADEKLIEEIMRHLDNEVSGGSMRMSSFASALRPLRCRASASQIAPWVYCPPLSR